MRLVGIIVLIKNYYDISRGILEVVKLGIYDVDDDKADHYLKRL
jgi:hypothetical protein